MNIKYDEGMNKILKSLEANQIMNGNDNFDTKKILDKNKSKENGEYLIKSKTNEGNKNGNAKISSKGSLQF